MQSCTNHSRHPRINFSSSSSSFFGLSIFEFWIVSLAMFLMSIEGTFSSRVGFDRTRYPHLHLHLMSSPFPHSLLLKRIGKVLRVTDRSWSFPPLLSLHTRFTGLSIFPGSPRQRCIG
ncbi:hypothetical protein IE53DRAFT_243428 [Violaceomyces palustris]|uniref:Uncharacterized protein n=1 Tax=Violaceomyces palustris TaxID=1673888 RepID=A0ACD0NP97_9BASI|nr:hypothetical protein IE53DRAFT_243428 [Violaceomyces palustris]